MLKVVEFLKNSYLFVLNFMVLFFANQIFWIADSICFASRSDSNYVQEALKSNDWLVIFVANQKDAYSIRSWAAIAIFISFGILIYYIYITYTTVIKYFKMKLINFLTILEEKKRIKNIQREKILRFKESQKMHQKRIKADVH